MKSVSFTLLVRAFLAALFISWLSVSDAQTFEKAFKDPIWATQFSAVKQSGNFYYACGYASSPTDGIYFGDFSKIDLNGNLIWTRRPFGETTCRFFDFEITESGDFIIVGRTEPTSNTQGQALNNRSVISRISPAGVVAFARSYEFSALGREGLWSIKRDADQVGTFFIAGHTNGPDGASSTDRVLLLEMTDTGVFTRISELLSTVIPAAQTDNEFFLKIDQPNVPTSIMWLGGVRRTVNSSVTYGLITGIEENNHDPVLATLLDPGTVVRDILPEPTTPVLRIVGVGKKDNEAIFFAYYPQAPSGFIWSVGVAGQADFLKVVKAATPNHYYVLGQTTGTFPVHYVVHYFDASGTIPVIVWSKQFDEGETDFSDPGLLAPTTNQFMYFDTRLGNPGGTGKEVFLAQVDPANGNCLTQSPIYTATPIMLNRTVPNVVRQEVEVPDVVDGVATLIEYEERRLCELDCPKSCITNTISLNTGKDKFYGQYDASWMLIESPDASMSLPRAANVINACWPCGWTFQNNASWISAFPNHFFWENNPSPASAYVFENCFCSCEDSALATIDLSVLADDAVDIDLYDDSGNFIQDITTVQSFGTPVASSNQVLMVQPGTYCVRAALRNLSNVALGLNIVGNITGNNLLKRECCRPQNIIQGVKYQDDDGDGFRDYNLNASPSEFEPGIAGWKIMLCDQLGNLIQTVETDAWGYYSFIGVPAGTYMLKEETKPGWVQKEPGGAGFYTITLDEYGVQENKAFGNRLMTATQSPDVSNLARLSPNPTAENIKLTLKMPMDATCEIILTDMTGRVLQAQTLELGHSTLDLNTSALASGTYSVQIQRNGLLLWTARFVKL